MRLRGISFLECCRHSFPSLMQGGFPTDALMVRYLERLAPITPLHPDFIQLVVEYAGPQRLRTSVEEWAVESGNDLIFEKVSCCKEEHDLIHLFKHPLSFCFDPQTEKEFRVCMQKALHEVLPPLPDPEGLYTKRIERLQTLLGLSEEHVRALEVCVCYKTCRPFESFCDHYHMTDWIALIATALGLPLEVTSDCLVGKGSLHEKHLIKFRPMSIEVLEPLFQYLIGMKKDFLDQDMFSLDAGPTFPLESFPLEPRQLELLRQTVSTKDPCHLFLYGRPGTGKTELARALAAEAGLQPFLVRAGGGGHGHDRSVALSATLSVVPPDALLIIDEADGLLNTDNNGLPSGRKVDKGWVNQFMDECSLKTIWISNQWAGIPASTLRRFSYSHEFHTFSEGQRRSSWEQQLKHHHLEKHLTPAMITRFSRTYQVDAGGISSTLRTVKPLILGGHLNEGKIEQSMEELLTHHERLSGKGDGRRKRMPRQTCYDAAALHTDVPLDRILRGLRNRKTSVEDGEPPYAAALLFWGQPGTGKTEFARHLARELGCELVSKRMSDLQSKFVGETEKRIASAFAEAEATGAILLLDEADSLFLDRQTAERSWQSSQTNEVLTQLENFTGICICCTNLLDHLDGAALRRFAWKVEFRPLTSAGRERLFTRYFMGEAELPSAIREGLNELHLLTPGDFKVVAQQARFDGSSLTPIKALEALKQETRYKKGAAPPIGFSTATV